MRKIYFLIFSVLFLSMHSSIAQTTLISATGDGGFENGASLAANNWQVANSTTDQWTQGTAPAVFAGGACAYISGAPGGTWTYSQFSVIQHLYRDFTVPAGEPVTSLNFKWKANGEGTTTNDYDNIKVFIAPTSVTPTANTAIAAAYQVSGPGATSGMYKLSSAAYNDETISVALVPGTTYRLVFSWKSDGSTIGNPPAALDNISLTTRASTNISSTAIGGLWSSPATWVGGVVPVGDNVTIADGAIVTIDQAAYAGTLTIGGGTSGILQWNGTANALNATSTVTVNPGANLNMFTAAAAPNGVAVNVGGDFINNGTVHAAYVNASHTVINMNSSGTGTSTISGSGTFVGGIVSALFFQNLGSNVIATTQPLVTRSFALTAGSLNTNGKLSIDNTAQVYGQPFNQKVYEIVVTSMGSGYNSATPPTITIAAPTGTGVTATATPNIDDVTGTLRSITITNAGDGYRANPTITIAGGTGTGAAATAVVNTVSSGTTAGLTQKSGATSLTGGLSIKSEQSVSTVFATGGGVGYTSAPAVGFALPTGFLNLVTNGGSGYTTAPTVTVSGGTSLTGSTNPTFTVVVAQGKVVSVIASAGGTLWTSVPTLTITGGGGTGATAAFPANCLATANASISNGMVDNFIVTNKGAGYTAAPAVGLVGGGATTAATGVTSRVGLYNLNMGWYGPSPAPAPHVEDATIPANRRINVLTMGNGGATLTSNLELYSSAPIVLTAGVVNMGANTLTFSHPAYAGQTGNTTSSVSGTIILNTPGGSLTRTFPYDAPLAVVTGTGSLATGSTVTTLTASRTAAPTGTVSPSGNPIGTRAYHVVANAGAVYGTNPTVTLNWNATDALVSDNPNLYISQSTALTGPWTVRSASSGTGILAATGSRTTATAAPGPIVPNGDDFYAWTSTYIPPITSVASGDWNAGSTWSSGVVPTCSDNIQINATHNVTVTSAGDVCKSLTIASGGTLTVSAGDVTVGCTLNNNPFTDAGTLTVTGGTLNINGNMSVLTAAKLNQSGGAINVDGNAAGVTANSVASGTYIVSIAAATASDINLTGGVFTIVDPHAAATSTMYVNYSTAGSINTSPNHTFRFGDGVSTDNGSASGFEVYNWAGTGIFTYGNVILEAVTGGTNRFVKLTSTYYNMVANGDITINSGAELSQLGTAITGGLFVGKNLIVNAGGTLTSAGIVYFGTATAATGTTLTLSPVSLAQSIGGAGTFRNSATPTANLTSITVHNTHASGVTFNTPISLSGTLTMTAGVINTTATNLLTLGYNATNTGTLTYTAGQISGPFKRWIGTTTGSRVFPVGTSSQLKNAAINFTVAPTAAGSLTANFSAAIPNFPNAGPLMEGALTVNSVSKQGSWFIQPGDGLTGGTYTATMTANGSTDIVDYTKTVLVYRATAGADWALNGTHVTTTGSNTAPVLSRTGMAGFFEYAIGGEANIAIPVTIEYFKGNKQSAGNLLDWKVSCYNSPYAVMTLERSADGRSFAGINSSKETALRCLQPFQYLDASPLSGLNYYRLKSVDADGKVSYSAIVLLINKDNGYELVNLVPNPVRTNAVFTISSAVNSSIDLRITAANGQVISKELVQLKAGNNPLMMNFSKLAAGTYHITAYSADGQVRTISFVKQ